VYVFGVIYLAGICYLSDRLQKRAIMAVTAPIPVLVGYAIVIGTPSVGAGYFAMFMCSGGKMHCHVSNKGLSLT